jgi:hypothetical protein
MMPTTTEDRTTVTATGNGHGALGSGPGRGLLSGVSAALAALALSACGSPGGNQTAAPPAGPIPFPWFRSGPAPAGWQPLELPDTTAVLAIPPDAAPVPGDPTSVSATITAPGGDLQIYFNATPQQGDESLANWPEFRLAHLTGENAASASRLQYRAGMEFRGGTGSCVEDTYVTRIGAHKYREIACLVAGIRGSSVLVVASPADSWDRYSPVLEQAVDAYAPE